MITVTTALLPGFLYANGTVNLRMSFTVLRDWAPFLVMVTLAVGTGALGYSLLKRNWLAALLALIAIIIAISVWFSVTNFLSKVQIHPLHDVTTNVDAPPLFEAIEPRNYGSGGSAAAYPHPRWRARHLEIYPDIEPLLLKMPMASAFERAREIATEMDWEIKAAKPGEDVSRIEATATTPWFRFKDDVVVVLTQVDERGVRVDMRSVSRIGISDLGKNAERIRAFFEALGQSS